MINSLYLNNIKYLVNNCDSYINILLKNLFKYYHNVLSFFTFIK